MTTKHGGKRKGAGKPPIYSKRMVRKTIHLPAEWAEELTADFGNFSAGARAAIENYLKNTS